MAGPSAGRQKREVDRLREAHEAELHEGDLWFVISSTWWKTWLEHVENGGPSPGVIDNAEIVDDSGKALKEDGVSEGAQYELRHEAVWKVLEEWYGATHQISGKVHRNSKNDLYVEVFPVRFYVLTVGPASGSPTLATHKLMVVPRSVHFADLVDMVREFIVSESRVSVPAKTDHRLWITEASGESYTLVGDEIMDDELKDVLTGLGKWKVIFEMKSAKSARWLCGDGSEGVSEQKRYSLQRRSTGVLSDDEDADQAPERDAGPGAGSPVLRGRAASFVRDEPLPGQLVDVKRRKDNRWHEAHVVEVKTTASSGGLPKRVVCVHFLSFEAADDEEFDVGDTERLASPYTRVPDWRTQLRKDEEVEVHRSAVGNAALKGAWLLGKVKQFDRQTGTAKQHDQQSHGSDGSSGTDEMDTDDQVPEGDDGSKPRRKRRNFMRAAMRAGSHLPSASRLSMSRSSPTPSPTTTSSTSSRGMVLVEVRTGTLFTQRKEVWLDLDSEEIAQRYTHTAKPKTTFGPQSVKERPKASGIVGLRNLGNTCFMNSMLQCLSLTLPLTDYFLRGDHEVDLNRKNPLGTGGKLAEAYAGLINEIWSDRFRVVVPSDFKQELGRAFTQFQGYQQQDSHELLSLLADGLHEDLNRVRKKPYTETVEPRGRPDEEVAQESWEVYKMRNDSVIVDEFMGLLRSHLTCPVCENEAVKFDPYSNWSVPIPKPTSRRINVVLYSMRTPQDGEPAQFPKMVRFVAEAPVSGSHSDVAAWLAERTGIPDTELLLVELYNNKKMTGGYLYNPTAPAPATKADVYRANYQSDLRHWDDNKDVVAYEVPVLRGEGASTSASAAAAASPPEPPRSAAQPKAGARAMDVSTARREAAAAAALARKTAPKTRLVELRFMTPESSYICFRLSDFFLVDGKITSRQMLNFIWQRCRFMFRDDAQLPAAFSAEFSSNPNERPGLGERVTADAPYHVYNSTISKVTVPVSDQPWNPTDTVVVKFTRKGVDALRFSPKTTTSYTARRDLSWEARDASYCAGPVELDETAELLRGPKAAKAAGLDIYECFDRFREREQLGENDEWYCPKCKDFVKAYKQMDLWSAPEILVVHLKRFYYERSRYVRSWIDREKINDLVDFPMEGLDLSDYVRGHKEGDPPPIYDLYAVSNHIGGMGGGHYTAYVYQRDAESWFLMDDARTLPAKPEEVVSDMAYVLFYQRRAS